MSKDNLMFVWCQAMHGQSENLNHDKNDGTLKIRREIRIKFSEQLVKTMQIAKAGILVHGKFSFKFNAIQSPLAAPSSMKARQFAFSNPLLLPHCTPLEILALDAIFLHPVLKFPPRNP